MGCKILQTDDNNLQSGGFLKLGCEVKNGDERIFGKGNFGNYRDMD